MRTGVSGHTGKLCVEREQPGKTMYVSRPRTKTSSEDIVCRVILRFVDEIVVRSVDLLATGYIPSPSRVRLISLSE